ncbi:GNAT family N-acetyltransferase [Colwellia sp. D2M02]|uniref:GNAT family N-acetyltransferase n=1 Tax=Colwellia sp. D2M02 TaxID=2841562 RepID=UPI001C089E35|nr:GNAT family N-acetyltransferase [Colwellia sp. D2M02]MBU2892351.1 GNAT family N-acetyltransferase [Colwellia sp. D2M02]
MIRTVCEHDTQAITNIYNHYILNSVATFETNVITSTDMAQRIEQVQNAGFPWLVAHNAQGDVIGYAYANTWKARLAYRFTAEITVYVDQSCAQQGTGSKLYSALFAQLRESDIRTVVGCITLPNIASERLHEKFAMEKVGHFKDVGFKFDQWLDVGFWQGTLK